MPETDLATGNTVRVARINRTTGHSLSRLSPAQVKLAEAGAQELPTQDCTGPPQSGSRQGQAILTKSNSLSTNETNSIQKTSL